MALYAVTYSYTDDDDTLDRVRPEHREYLRGLVDQEHLVLSGPWASGELPGALLLFQADTRDAVEGFVAKDPFTEAGVISEYSVTEWEPVMGSLYSEL
ncbi:YciI family protein [Pseudonocardia pini]|uniref:YciI family protein n=1 Tax=Pseudonocardia pini TaxID=2758030 RepID=UPI0015F01A8A|nr:YciI family protein [Pseudonocardia pini]